MYLAEKDALLVKLINGHPDLWMDAARQIYKEEEIMPWLQSGDRVRWTNMPKPYATGTVTDDCDDDCFTVKWDDGCHSTFRWNVQWLEKITEEKR